MTRKPGGRIERDICRKEKKMFRNKMETSVDFGISDNIPLKYDSRKFNELSNIM